MTGSNSLIPPYSVLFCAGMTHRFAILLTVIFASLVAAAPASAHPHVWVTIKTDIIFDKDGVATGVRHTWSFDDAFSVYATQGIAQKTKGTFSREELAPLAEENVTALKEYKYYTVARADGKRLREPFADGTDYWLDYKDEILTLHYTLPFKTPVKAKDLIVEVYDPEFFTYLAFAEKEPAKLTNAPANCSFTVANPGEGQFPSSQRLDRSFQASEANAGSGAKFASKVLVKCE